MKTTYTSPQGQYFTLYADMLKQPHLLVEYKNLPHTITYASEPADMVQALNTAMQITERRYKVMQ